MFVRYHPPADFPELLRRVEGNVRLLNVFCVLKFHADGCYEDAVVSVRSVEDASGLFFGVALELLGGKSLTVVLQSDSNERAFVQAAIRRMLGELQETLEKHTEVVFPAVAPPIATALCAHFDAVGSHPHMPMNEPAVMFVADHEQRERLERTRLELPAGFEFVELPVEAAAAICAEVIALRSAHQEEVLASKIAHLPAVGVRECRTGRLASYATNDGTGLISNLYTRPAFRRRGFAKLVEQRLAQLNARRHALPPFKAVGVDRPRVLAMSRALYLWTEVPNSEPDQPPVYRWIGRTKQPQERVVFIEN